MIKGSMACAAAASSNPKRKLQIKERRSLDVESQDVVQGEAKLGYGRLVLKSAVGSVPVVVVKEEGQMGGADA